MSNEENKRQHLEFIQNVITRMNSNSFQLKGWMIAIVTALLALYAACPKVYFIFLGIIPTLIFWLLDSYYLLQERKFRGLYNDVAGIKEKVEGIKPYEMPVHKYKKSLDKQYGYFDVVFSPTILCLYLPLILFLLFFGLILICRV